MKYIYVDSLWMYIYTDLGRQMPADPQANQILVYSRKQALVCNPKSLSWTVSQGAGANWAHAGLPCIQVAQSLQGWSALHVPLHADMHCGCSMAFLWAGFSKNHDNPFPLHFFSPCSEVLLARTNGNKVNHLKTNRYFNFIQLVFSLVISPFILSVFCFTVCHYKTKLKH